MLGGQLSWHTTHLLKLPQGLQLSMLLNDLPLQGQYAIDFTFSYETATCLYCNSIVPPYYR